MARHGELGIFRRFGKLGLQNLLYLQAELTHLENDLENLACRDAGHKLREEHSKDWYSLAQGYDQIEYEVENEAVDKVRTNKGECYIGKERGNSEGEDGANNDIEINSKDKGKLVEEEEIDEDREQWEKALQIREKLREYYENLSLQIYINNLPQPREHDIDFLRRWLERPKLGNYPLSSRDKDSWSAHHEDDLFALQRKPTSDPFSRWMIWSCVPYLHRKFLKHFKGPLPKEGMPEPSLPRTQQTTLDSRGNAISRTKILEWFSRGTIERATRSNTFSSGKTLVAECSDNTEISQGISAPRTRDMVFKDVEKGSSQELSPDSDDSNEYDGSQIFFYEDTRIVKAVTVLSIVFASMLPITSILVLYFVSNTINRLVIAVVFEGLFAFALAMTTRASRSEIFAATSAFAAVQVVFMTGSDGYIGQ
ncbi:hypothetical protein DID88_007840 [Monilinia fructigena]|uniref:DUF6594 domain-containing protein n=1 Tax=Monilinia fructigena TaxID=38457 RepID=A0A395J3K8_9HELO|nr:hypothetical protein DID88_007840 [Monilinia fructigena]